MEEWHVPICSNLPQEEVGYLKIDDVLEMWQTLGIEDGLKKTSKFFDQAEGSQTISVTNLRHSLDSVLKDVPGGQELLATYKTEITFLWEQFESAVQQAEKMKVRNQGWEFFYFICQSNTNSAKGVRVKIKVKVLSFFLIEVDFSTCVDDILTRRKQHVSDHFENLNKRKNVSRELLVVG